MLVVQLGHALAVVLLERIGVMMTAGFRAGFSALVLLLASRPAVRSLSRSQRRLVAIFGSNFVVQSLALYVAISRIPLGIALSIAFLGPLGTAVWRGRRARDLACAAMALTGVILLVETPGAAGDVDSVGLLAAAVAAGSWAVYIYCSERARATMPRLDGLALSMSLAACVLVPAAFISGPTQPLVPGDIGLGFATALLATAIPFSMESLALSRTPVHLFGILMSTEPAVAALVGFIALGQALPAAAVAGIALVVAASVTATLGGRRVTRKQAATRRYGRRSS